MGRSMQLNSSSRVSKLWKDLFISCATIYITTKLSALTIWGLGIGQGSTTRIARHTPHPTTTQNSILPASRGSRGSSKLWDACHACPVYSPKQRRTQCLVCRHARWRKLDHSSRSCIRHMNGLAWHYVHFLFLQNCLKACRLFFAIFLDVLSLRNSG